MGELVATFPELHQIIDQALPEDVALEDDGTGTPESAADFGDGGDKDTPTAPSDQEKRKIAKRKGRQSAEQRRSDACARKNAKTKADAAVAEKFAKTVMDQAASKLPFLSGNPYGGSKWSEATDKAESESAALDLAQKRMSAYDKFTADLEKAELADPSGTSFRVRYLKLQVQQLEAAMLPPESTNGPGAGDSSGRRGGSASGAAPGAGGGMGSGVGAGGEDAGSGGGAGGEGD